MGIIIRLYHRSEGLTKNKFNTFFMDMGENIHLHYRDIRIEFSVDEFIEFADLCDTYIPLVRKEIESGFKDGVNPNTNQSDTIKTFFNKKPLKNSITYNPTRISLEENTDGYHIHLRNYKILLDKPSFINFVQAAREAMDARARNVDLRETLDLIEINELRHTVVEITNDGPKQIALVSIEKPYYKKLLQLLDGLGYKKNTEKIEAYELDNFQVSLTVVPETAKLMPKVVSQSHIVPLTTYLVDNANTLTPKELNLLKLQVLDYYEYIKKNNLSEIVDINHQSILFNSNENKVIFPLKSNRGRSDVRQEWALFDRFLNKHKLGFVKPRKFVYNNEQLKGLDAAFRFYVQEHVSRHPCVRKIYLLNPMEWKKSGSQTGRYEVPFLHIAWAKLGSDFDILIEMDERYSIPESWDKKFFWKVCGCDYYHLGEVDFPVDNPYEKIYPNISFGGHLVEAYLFFPSRMDASVKDKYLSGFPSREIVYEKQDIIGLLPAFVKERYGIELETIDPIKGVGFNEVFRARSGAGDYIVKIMKGAEFTPPSKGYRGTHLYYEDSLLCRLAEMNAPVILPKPGIDGKLYQKFGEFNCMLTDFITADKVEELTREHICSVAKAIAQVNRALQPDTATTEAYRFSESLEFWLHDYVSLFSKFTSNEITRQQFESLIPAITKTRQQMEAASHIPWIHCHGDVTPRNVMFVNGNALLYDFQAARYSPRIEDLAEGALEFAFIDKQALIDPERVNEFIAAYDNEYPLMETERQLLPSMLFLHAAIKLGRLLRMQVVFGNQVNQNYVSAFLNYALANVARVE